MPIPSDAANALLPFLAGKLTNSIVWACRWAADHRGAEMLRGDLDVAGIAYAVDGPDGPE